MDTTLCNNVEKAFQSKEQPHWTPYLSASRSGNYNFFIPSYSAKLSISTVQSGPTLCVCILLRQEEKETNKARRTGLGHMSHLKRPKTNSQEVRGALSFQGGQGPPWARPRREDTPRRTSSSLSWQRWTAARGRLSYKLRSRVERGGWVPVETRVTSLPLPSLEVPQRQDM